MGHKKHRRTGKFNLPPKAKFTAVLPKSDNQRTYLKAIEDNDVIFCRGNAGTGKSLLALSSALDLYYNRELLYERIIIVRPYIKTKFHEDFGSLPGTADEKLSPFIEAIMDNLRILCSKEEADRLIKQRNIEFTIMSMCRGRSFNNCIVIVEEAQNVPYEDGMKMLLTRLGDNSKLIICGDTDQCDLIKEDAGFWRTAEKLTGIEGIAIVEMYDMADIQRNPIVRSIIGRLS